MMSYRFPNVLVGLRVSSEMTGKTEERERRKREMDGTKLDSASRLYVVGLYIHWLDCTAYMRHGGR